MLCCLPQLCIWIGKIVLGMKTNSRSYSKMEEKEGIGIVYGVLTESTTSYISPLSGGSSWLFGRVLYQIAKSSCLHEAFYVSPEHTMYLTEFGHATVWYSDVAMITKQADFTALSCHLFKMALNWLLTEANYQE